MLVSTSFNPVAPSLPFLGFPALAGVFAFLLTLFASPEKRSLWFKRHQL